MNTNQGPETLAEARAFDARAARYRDKGLSAVQAGRRAHGTPDSLSDLPALSEVLHHLAVYYSDWSIKRDMDSVRDSVDDEGWRVVRAYAKARRKAPGFRGNDSSSNNHSQIGKSGS